MHCTITSGKTGIGISVEYVSKQKINYIPHNYLYHLQGPREFLHFQFLCLGYVLILQPTNPHLKSGYRNKTMSLEVNIIKIATFTAVRQDLQLESLPLDEFKLKTCRTPLQNS